MTKPRATTTSPSPLIRYRTAYDAAVHRFRWDVGGSGAASGDGFLEALAGAGGGGLGGGGASVGSGAAVRQPTLLFLVNVQGEQHFTRSKYADLMPSGLGAPLTPEQAARAPKPITGVSKGALQALEPTASSQAGADCDAVCGLKGLACEGKLLPKVNTCDMMQSAFEVSFVDIHIRILYIRILVEISGTTIET